MMGVTVAGHFDAAHRILAFPGKCQSLHGHTWAYRITVTGRPDEHGIVVELGALKALVRDLVDGPRHPPGLRRPAA